MKLIAERTKSTIKDWKVGIKMWIRSQCLAILVKAKEICINDGTDIWANGYLIGEYSTEEKAFDVLDMIESWITHTTDGVFYMPADDEVEV